MKTTRIRPKCYRHPLYVPTEVYCFMISEKGVGNARNLFGLCGTAGYWHNPYELHREYKLLRVAWYKRKRDVITVLVWLIDWYHAAAKRTDGRCMFPNWDSICEI